MRADATNSSPELRKPTDQGPDPSQRRTSTREGNRGKRGGRGGGRGGNGGGPPRKDTTPASQDTAVPTPKLVVDPPATTNTPAEPSPISKPNPRPKPARRHSATVSEDSVSVSSQTGPRTSSRRKRSQQGKPSTASSNGPSKLLNVQTVQTSSTKASTAPSSPNPAKDLPPHLAPPTSASSTTELKTDIDALVERVRAVAMDRPHTPGSHIDWADDDDSLPDLNEWGYAERAAAQAKSEEPPASIPAIPEDVPPQPGIPEVKIEGEPSLDETKSEDAKPEPISDATPRTHKVQKTRSKRGDRSRGNSRTQQPPPALNLADSISQGPSLSPIQSTPSTAIPHTAKPREPRRQNPNQGQSPRNNQGQTNSKDNGGGNGGGRQRGQNGAVMASPMRNSFPAKTGPKANHTPPVQSQTPAQGQPPDVAHLVAIPSTDSESKPPGSKGEAVLDNERKETSIEPARKTGADDPNPNPATTNPTSHELVLIRDDPQPNSPQNQSHKRNSYNSSHNRAHTYGGRTQGAPQPPHSAPTPNFPHHSSNARQNLPNPQPPRSPDLRNSPDTRSSNLGLSRSTGYERHNRNHSSPSWGGGGATRAPQQTRPMITGDALNLLAKSLGGTPGSPKKDPHTPPPAS